MIRIQEYHGWVTFFQCTVSFIFVFCKSPWKMVFQLHTRGKEVEYASFKKLIIPFSSLKDTLNQIKINE